MFVLVLVVVLCSVMVIGEKKEVVLTIGVVISGAGSIEGLDAGFRRVLVLLRCCSG